MSKYGASGRLAGRQVGRVGRRLVVGSNRNSAYLETKELNHVLSRKCVASSVSRLLLR
jgi:hypothetical protein